jgi:heterodisulfide reductase subunit A2
VRHAGLNPYLLELVNLRDQCARVHGNQPELANRKALELVRVAAGRVRAARPVRKQRYTTHPEALVIGGGLSGMTAALAIADSGYTVHLVERSAVLGGNLQNMYYVAEGDNPRLLGRDLVNRVRAHQRVLTHLRTEVIAHGGHVGQFWAELRTSQPGGAEERSASSMASPSWPPARARRAITPCSSWPQVITQQELEEKVVVSPEEIAALKHVVMIQCVQPMGGVAYCSRVCCTETMKNAIRLRLFNPNCQVTVLYKNITTYGFREQYYTNAREHGVVFMRYTEDGSLGVVPANGGLTSACAILALNRWMTIPADLVVLSMPVVPAAGTVALANMLRVPLSSEGFFAEAQMKLRPMDFMREGIFLAGWLTIPSSSRKVPATPSPPRREH